MFHDPHSDPATALLVDYVPCIIADQNGRKTDAAATILGGTYSTALAPDELLVSIDVPCLPGEFGSSDLRIHRLQ